MILIYFVMGIGIGTASVVSRAVGEGDHQKVRRLVTDGLLLTVLLAGVLTFLGLWTIKPLFTFLGAQRDVLTLINDYMRVWYIGIGFIVISMVTFNIIRALGDATSPGILMMFSALLNLVLDPIFIFGLFGFPALGIKGAALASLTAFSVSTVLSLMIVAKREKLFWLSLDPHIFRSWKEILYIGLPSATSNVIIHLAIAVVVKLLATFGEKAVAGFGIATRIEAFALAVYFALSSIIGPFVGQNWGAGKIQRIQEGLRLSDRFCLLWGLFLAVIFALFARPLVGLFDQNELVLAVASLYLLIVPLSYGAEGVLMMTTSAFNALGRPLPATFLSLTRMFVFYIPLAYLGKAYFGFIGIFAAAFIANIVTGWFSFKLQEARAFWVRQA